MFRVIRLPFYPSFPKKQTVPSSLTGTTDAVQGADPTTAPVIWLGVSPLQRVIGWVAVPGRARRESGQRSATCHVERLRTKPHATHCAPPADKPGRQENVSGRQFLNRDAHHNGEPLAKQSLTVVATISSRYTQTLIKIIVSRVWISSLSCLEFCLVNTYTLRLMNDF